MAGVGLRVVNRVRFFSAVGVAAAVVLLTVGVLVARSGGDGNTELSSATTLRRATTTTESTATTTTSTTLAQHATAPTTRRVTAATPTTPRAPATTATTLGTDCGHWTWSSTKQDDYNAQVHVVLAGNTTFGGRPSVTFDMRYTAPASGPASYSASRVGGSTGHGTYSITFPTNPSENGGAVVVTARADGIATTCQSHPIRIQCCDDSPAAGA